MLLLAFDTATPAVTVALHDGDEVVAQSLAVDARRHGELLAPGIEQVLGDAGVRPGDLTDIAVGTGPGPFTGLRVGLVTAISMASALGIRAHGLCTLDALALRAVQEDAVVPEGDFLVATDARRREVYWAAYEQRPDGSVGAVPQRVHGPAVSRPADVPVGGRPVVGRGADLYPDHLGLSIGPIDPSAAALAHLAVQLLDKGADLSDLTPRYLRRPDVHEGGPRKTVLS
ncbi:tRNA (adenosine(37)-N6)-threonylcarbamoyltransferase complex dimerization subunit type 1 TsaB [Angustibacter luteus]|uniref:tRNA (Adenosine(37)-N6)-threonylcarbamoyltransferase complex dimerization subunit type 1 TsaB n=1 Tax=Angustibacter luteus TaxID=658456 RepID=A0ABW1JF41_9ACTN